MVQSNEFVAPTLDEAIAKAMADYRRRDEKRSGKSCTDLVLELADAKSRARSLLREAESLRRSAKALERTAKVAGAMALVNAASALAGAFGTAARALRLIARMRFKDLDRKDLLSLVPFLGPGAAALVSAVAAHRSFEEADRLARQAGIAEARADQLGKDILRIADEYRRAGCGSRPMTS